MQNQTDAVALEEADYMIPTKKRNNISDINRRVSTVKPNLLK